MADDLNALADWHATGLSNSCECATCEKYRQTVAALRRLAALEAGGMVMVPKEPTPEMVREHNRVRFMENGDVFRLWHAMLAARPQGGK